MSEAEPTPMFDVHCEGDFALVTVKRSSITDEDNLELLGESMQDLVMNVGIRRLILDLSTLRHVTSSVLGKWIFLHRSIHREGGRMVVCGVDGEIAEVFAATRLETLFETAETVEAARELLDAA